MFQLWLRFYARRLLDKLSLIISIKAPFPLVHFTSFVEPDESIVSWRRGQHDDWSMKVQY